MDEMVYNEYKLTPIRDEDKYAIAGWRNDQIDILRQKQLLTNKNQEDYFRNVVDKLFDQDLPDQLLFSFFENDILVGYGGLVHIDWESKNAEISFITATQRNESNAQFLNDWGIYLKMIKRIAASYLGFHKIYTYAYDVRPRLYDVLIDSNFVEEGRLRNHVAVKDKLCDVLIHSFFLDSITLRAANGNDSALMFNWRNESLVRQNSFSQEAIEFDGHQTWYEKKLKDPGCSIFIANLNGTDIGQIRFDKNNADEFEIDFSIDKNFRGKGLGDLVIRNGIKELLKKRNDVQRVVAKVKKDNLPSQRSFLHSGFKLMGNADNNSSFSLYYLDNE